MKPVLSTALLVAIFAPSAAHAQEQIPVGMIFSKAPPNNAPTSEQRLRELVMRTQEFSSMAMFDASASTPTAADLAGLSAVFVWNDAAFGDPRQVGDVLADFARSGGGVVVAGHTFSPGGGLALEGNFVTQNFMPVEPADMLFMGGDQGIIPAAGQEWLPELFQAGHPIFWVVNDIDGGASEMVDNLEVDVDAEVVGHWTDGEPAVITFEPPLAFYGRVVALNLFPDVTGGGFTEDALDDFDHLVANALLWSARWETLPSPDWCYNILFTQDLNCNHVDLAEEDALDVTLPGCDTEIDPRTNLPYDNADYYWDIHRFDCEYPTFPYWDQRSYDLDVRYDGTGDWLSAGTITVDNPDLPFPVESITLSCDNCSSEWNHDQRDRDCDGNGDPCDLCIWAPPPFGAHWDDDSDGWGDDACDNAAPSLVCPPPGGDSFNPDQSDVDLDGIGDVCDNCPFNYNPCQTDVDFDFVGDPPGPDCLTPDESCDNCPPGSIPGDPAPSTANPTQANLDGDLSGDICDNCYDIPNTDGTFGPRYSVPQNQGDVDGDYVGDLCDNCPTLPFPDRLDSDADGIGDACDTCVYFINPDQSDGDADGFGNACDNCVQLTNSEQEDQDVDNVGDACDNCLVVANQDQSNVDRDDLGDSCDMCPRDKSENSDADEDGWGDECDLCPQAGTYAADDDILLPDPNIDSDADGIGDACDNCVYAQNPNQENSDAGNGDVKGDACDRFAIRGGGENIAWNKLTNGCDSTGGALAPWAAVGLLALAVRRRR